MMTIFHKNTLFPLCFLICPALFAQNNGWNGYQSQNKPTEAVAPTQNPAPEVQFYLLRTGFLTEGTATNDGKQYSLKTNFGTMHIPIANVEFVGQTREDIYRYKKEFVDDRNCNELMKFAEWCFSNKLPQQGILQYQAALAVAPNSVLAEVIRKRLETAQNSDPNSDAEPGRLSSVQVEQRTADDDTDTGLGNWGNGIPKPILDSFTKKVQPVLVSRCAAASCHGSSSDNEFKLKIPRHTLGNTTYRNLRAVIQWIDLDYPTESQLLSALVTVHGGSKPALSVESPQYHNLVQWVQTAAKELPKEYRTPQISRTESQKTKDKESANLLPPALRNAMTNAPPMEKPQGEDIPTTFLAPPTNSTVPVNYAPTSLNVPNSPSDDPFDPGIFNARYHGVQKRR